MRRDPTRACSASRGADRGIPGDRRGRVRLPVPLLHGGRRTAVSRVRRRDGRAGARRRVPHGRPVGRRHTVGTELPHRSGQPTSVALRRRRCPPHPRGPRVRRRTVPVTRAQSRSLRRRHRERSADLQRVRRAPRTPRDAHARRGGLPRGLAPTSVGGVLRPHHRHDRVAPPAGRDRDHAPGDLSFAAERDAPAPRGPPPRSAREPRAHRRRRGCRADGAGIPAAVRPVRRAPHPRQARRVAARRGRRGPHDDPRSAVDGPGHRTDLGSDPRGGRPGPRLGMDRLPGLRRRRRARRPHARRAGVDQPVPPRGIRTRRRRGQRPRHARRPRRRRGQRRHRADRRGRQRRRRTQHLPHRPRPGDPGRRPRR